MDPRDKDGEDGTEEQIPDTEPSPKLPDSEGTKKDPFLEGFKSGNVVVEEDDGEYG